MALLEALVSLNLSKAAIRPAPVRSAKESTVTNVGSTPTNLRVLVAEDNDVNQKVAVRMLSKLGIRADVVANGLEAIEAVQYLPYDIVFMDCNMPEMDGLAATNEIRRREGSQRRTCIIAMTANAMKGERERCVEAGMDDYVAKPVTMQELRSVIQRWRPSTHPGPGSPTDADHQTEATVVLDRKRLDDLADLGDEEDAQWLPSLIRRFREDAASRIVKLVVAAETGDAHQLEHLAHTLKGSCVNVGAQTMADIAHRIQNSGRSGNVSGATDLIALLERELSRVEAELEAFVTVYEKKV
jgi:CheY-like chemotaxis protein/HPt (histidine-containing phosphotransfer) domain-containing protein